MDRSQFCECGVLMWTGKHCPKCSTDEIILAIREIEKTSLNGNDGEENDVGISGYEIVTTKQIINFSITNEQNCCESWGYLISDGCPHDFIHSKLLNITRTDEALKTYDLSEEKDERELSTMFINIITDEGVLQLVAYNQHNGYYGHTVKIESKQLTLKETL